MDYSAVHFVISLLAALNEEMHHAVPGSTVIWQASVQPGESAGKRRGDVYAGIDVLARGTCYESRFEMHKVETLRPRVVLCIEAMENLSTEQEQQTLAALADDVDSINFFFWQESEHFCLPCTAATPSSMDSDQACPINDYQGCNELLFDIGMEFREQRGGLIVLGLLSNRRA
ncbi:hypothetical protein MRX96_030031 [Rhipicephalus microplus]